MLNETIEVTPETVETSQDTAPEAASAPRLSTRQLLEKIPNYPCLYRHSVNQTYYAIKKHGGKRKEHSLDTTDRKIAERRLREWIANLDEIDVEAEKTTLSGLLDKFVAGRQGMSESTKDTEAGIIKALKADWGYGLDIRVSRIRPTMLDEWLAKQKLLNSSYNRYTLFLKQLFEVAVGDGMIPKLKNPYLDIKLPWKNPKKTARPRNVPTVEQFETVIRDIRNQPFNPHAEESADFVEFEGRAGLGQAEVSSLTWGQIDWQGKKIRNIRRQKTGQLFEVPFYPHLVPLLEKLRNRFEKNFGVPPSPETKVFSIKDGRKALTNSLKRLGFAHFTQRNLRSFLIIYLGRQGISPKRVARWQGHQDGGKLILDTYSEAFSQDDERLEAELVAKLPNALANLN